MKRVVGLSALLLAVVLLGALQSGLSQPASPLLDPQHPAWSERAPEMFRVRFSTSEGDLLIEVFRRWAPHGSDRFYNLVRLGFYDETRVYRVREGAFAQFGLSGDPAVNRTWYEERMPDDPPRRANLRGTVSYAMLEQPGTRTTQVFVNLRDNAEQDTGGFAPFGRVVEGMEAADRFFAGYGEQAGGGMRGGRQGRIVAEGNAHLDADFPQLSRILSARIEPGEVMRYPDVGANRIRAEVHMLPAVSTGPMDPTWSPDGTQLAFAMRGDLWAMDAAGGTARAITRGPGYYSEPAWSPDGRWIAFSRDLDGNLDVGIVPAAGGEPTVLASHPHVDAQPTWSADSSSLIFSSARDGSFDLWRVPLGAPGDPARLVAGPGHQIQPAVSPDGSRLAFVSPVRGRLGTGGLWVLPLDDAGDADTASERATLVHWEETSFRAEPAWTADGRDLVFVSDEGGSNDIAAIPVAGGARLRLTDDDAQELDPVVSPDGTRVAFVSNRGGPTRLVVMPIGGARREDWQRPHVEALEPLDATGSVHVRVVDADTGEPLTARVHVLAADERSYAPAGAFHRVISATDTHYFHAEGEATVELPGGAAHVEVMHGPEYLPAWAEIDVEPGSTTELELSLQRLVDMPASGWIGGDTHSHDLHQGRWDLSHEDYFEQLVAEDLHVTNGLIHMDGTRWMGRPADLTGEPSPLSTSTHVLQYAQEYRGAFGHVGLLGIQQFAMPLVGGTPGTLFAADALNADWVEAARAQGGIAGFMHPYSSPVDEPRDGSDSEIALDVALGAGDFYDVVNYPYDDRLNAAMYWRFLDAGFRLPATGGSDNFADAWRDAPPGSARTYARAGERPDLPAWLDAVRAGKTFATNGPLLLLHLAPRDPQGSGPIGALAIGPGDTIALGPEATTEFEAMVEVASVAPLDTVDIVVNGEVVHRVDVRAEGKTFSLSRTIHLAGAGWIAAVAHGPAARAVTDGYPYAHTSPVWVERGGARFTDPGAARFLADVVRAQWQRVQERDLFPDAASRERYRAAAEEALRIYEEIAAGGPAPRRRPGQSSLLPQYLQ